MGLAVVQIGDRKSQSGILDKRFHLGMRIEDVRGGLLPDFGVGDDIIQVALDDIPNLLARPVVDVGRRSWPS